MKNTFLLLLLLVGKYLANAQYFRKLLHTRAMQIDSVNPVRASRIQVWTTRSDPEVLARCVPGVRTLTLIDKNTFKMLL